jgi:hypothetical protein
MEVVPCTAPTYPRSLEIAAHQKVQMGTGSEMRGKREGRVGPGDAKRNKVMTTTKLNLGTNSKYHKAG